jgi:signal peptidase I
MYTELGRNETHTVKCELVADVLRSYGTVRLQVTGWSMFPMVRPGDELVVDQTGRSEVVPGDIVLFAREQRLFAHRVVANHGSGMLTRGDAMPAPDPPVGESELLGRVSLITRGGKRIQPRRTSRTVARAIAQLVQRSEVAARVILGIYGLLQSQIQLA